MKEKILTGIKDPRTLEALYRQDKSAFKTGFRQLYPEIKENPLAEFWHERLNFDDDTINWGNSRELLFVLIAALVGGFLARIPHLFPIDEDFFYPRNFGFIFLPLLTAYFAWKKRLEVKKRLVLGAIIIVSLIYINLLPFHQESDSLILACIHLPLLLWVLLGSAFVGNKISSYKRRLEFLSYNGDLLIMTGLIIIAGGLMTAITIGLFSVIGMDIEEFYFRNVVIFGLPAAPIIGTYLIQANPQLVGKVSPVIARIFTPLVLVMLVIYLGAMLYSGGDPYNDREFLIMFNLLLVAVMAIIFFSVAETSKTVNLKAEKWMLFLLGVLTIIVNGIALSAILFRIAEWGITPNRAAVLGGNILILINLVLVSLELFRVLFKQRDVSGVGKAIAVYLPVYFAWTVIVVFLFPLIFGFG